MRVHPVPLLATSFVLLALLAGCSSPSQPASAPAETQPMAWAAGPGVAALQCGYGDCYEPSIASDPAGRLFVVDGRTSPVEVSEDGGLTWQARDPPPMPDGLSGVQSDVVVQVAPGGRLYWSALVAARTPTGYLLEGVQVAWSDDGAKTWAGSSHAAPIAGTPQVIYPDRQWLGFAPDGTLYLTYNQIPTGIWLARSDDGGESWTGWTRAAPAEGRDAGAGQSGPPVVTSDGAVLVPACQGLATAETGTPRTYVFRSSDRGATFQRILVDAPCSWFPIAAVAPDGTVVLADQPDSVQVAWSTDGGRSFQGPTQWGSGGTTAGVWPLPQADGGLAVAWYGDDGTLHLTRGTLADGPKETLTPGEATGGGTPRTMARTDFASAARLPDGRVATVWVDGEQAIVSVTNA